MTSTHGDLLCRKVVPYSSSHRGSRPRSPQAARPVAVGRLAGPRRQPSGHARLQAPPRQCDEQPCVSRACEWAILCWSCGRAVFQVGRCEAALAGTGDGGRAKPSSVSASQDICLLGSCPGGWRPSKWSLAIWNLAYWGPLYNGRRRQLHAGRQAAGIKSVRQPAGSTRPLDGPLQRVVLYTVADCG